MNALPGQDLCFARPRSPLLPDQRGFFGDFGGRYVPEVLMPNLIELDHAFAQILRDDDFWDEFVRELSAFSGRPTPVTLLKNLSDSLGGARIYVKREDLSQTGAHKINNVIGQGLLVKRLGKKRVIAETGAGQHGVATATMAARFGLQARIYMGAEDVKRQRPNVFWMQQMGAEVVSVAEGSQTLKDAINEALRDWATNFESTHYVLGTACGPHPFPAMVAYFQSIIGLEASRQMENMGVLPRRVYACVGGGSNAIGVFQGFLGRKNVELVGVEAGGQGDAPGQNAARISGGGGTTGIAQGYKTMFLQDGDGQMLDTHSVAAGLDYVGISPILADFAEKGMMRVERALDEEVVAAIKLVMAKEGLIPALESAHGLACAIREAPRLPRSDGVLVNLSGRGDKDIFTIASALGDTAWGEYLVARAKELEGHV